MRAKAVPADLDARSALPVLEQLVRASARAELLPRFGAGHSRVKGDGSLVTAADIGMQARLVDGLYARWPQIPVLGEEMGEAEQRAALSSRAGVWCLDPLDGTTNFVNGLPFFAVSLAFLRNGQPLLGLVYDPLREECFSAVSGVGAWLNGADLRATDAGSLARSVAAVDFKRLAPELAARLGAKPPYASQRSFGACALDWCWLALGRVQVCLHGGQKLWDYAAGSLILEQAGGRATACDGSPIRYDRLDPCSVLAASSGGLYAAWRDWVGGA